MADDQFISVEIPGVGDVEFPSSMSPDAINTAAAKLHADAVAASKPKVRPYNGKAYSAEEFTDTPETIFNLPVGESLGRARSGMLMGLFNAAKGLAYDAPKAAYEAGVGGSVRAIPGILGGMVKDVVAAPVRIGQKLATGNPEEMGGAVTDAALSLPVTAEAGKLAAAAAPRAVRATAVGVGKGLQAAEHLPRIVGGAAGATGGGAIGAVVGAPFAGASIGATGGAALGRKIAPVLKNTGKALEEGFSRTPKVVTPAEEFTAREAAQTAANKAKNLREQRIPLPGGREAMAPADMLAEADAAATTAQGAVRPAGSVKSPRLRRAVDAVLGKGKPAPSVGALDTGLPVAKAPMASGRLVPEKGRTPRYETPINSAVKGAVDELATPAVESVEVPPSFPVANGATPPKAGTFTLGPREEAVLNGGAGGRLNRGGAADSMTLEDFLNKAIEEGQVPEGVELGASHPSGGTFTLGPREEAVLANGAGGRLAQGAPREGLAGQVQSLLDELRKGEPVEGVELGRSNPDGGGFTTPSGMSDYARVTGLPERRVFSSDAAANPNAGGTLSRRVTDLARRYEVPGTTLQKILDELAMDAPEGLSDPGISLSAQSRRAWDDAATTEVQAAEDAARAEAQGAAAERRFGKQAEEPVAAEEAASAADGDGAMTSVPSQDASLLDRLLAAVGGREGLVKQELPTGITKVPRLQNEEFEQVMRAARDADVETAYGDAGVEGAAQSRLAALLDKGKTAKPRKPRAVAPRTPRRAKPRKAAGV